MIKTLFKKENMQKNPSKTSSPHTLSRNETFWLKCIFLCNIENAIKLSQN